MTNCAYCIYCTCTVRTGDFHGTHYPKHHQPTYLRADQLPNQGPDHRREALPGEALPSIRALAKDLKISVITTKRAYDELEADGFLYTVAGKGCFVAEKNLDLVREQQQRELEEHLRAAAALARSCGVSREELSEMLRILTEEDTDL